MRREFRSTALLVSLGLAWTPLVSGCDGTSDGRTAEEALKAKAKDEEKAAAERDAAKKAAEEKKKEPVLELPWSGDDVATGLKAGQSVTWKVTGKDAKGKDVEDQFRCDIKSADSSSVGITCNTVNTPSKDKGAGQVATSSWSHFAPFFSVEQPKHELVKLEKVTVPAGEFDCVVVELKGFMGNHRTIWMITEKPGMYAKVVDHGNANAEDDQTELVYELES